MCAEAELHFIVDCRQKYYIEKSTQISNLIGLSDIITQCFLGNQHPIKKLLICFLANQKNCCFAS